MKHVSWSPLVVFFVFLFAAEEISLVAGNNLLQVDLFGDHQHAQKQAAGASENLGSGSKQTTNGNTGKIVVVEAGNQHVAHSNPQIFVSNGKIFEVTDDNAQDVVELSSNQQLLNAVVLASNKGHQLSSSDEVLVANFLEQQKQQQLQSSHPTLLVQLD